MSVNINKINNQLSSEVNTSQQQKEFDRANQDRKKIAVIPVAVGVAVAVAPEIVLTIETMAGVALAAFWPQISKIMQQSALNISQIDLMRMLSGKIAIPKNAAVCIGKIVNKILPAPLAKLINEHVLNAVLSPTKSKTREEEIVAELKDLLERDPHGKGPNAERILDLQKELNQIRSGKAKAGDTNSKIQSFSFGMQNAVTNVQVEALQKQLDRLLNNGSSNSTPEAQRAIADLKRRIRDMQNL